MVAPNATAWSEAFALGATPRPRLSVSEWADRFRVVAAGTSPEPDRWRTSRVPYLREPMDAISDPSVERVVLQAGSQLGKSELLLNVIGYFVDSDPSPILLVQPTELASRAFVKERVEPTFRSTPALAGKLADGLRDKGNTVMLKVFPGGYMACAWSTSAVALASRPIRVVLLDEVDRYPISIGHDGDPVAQAIQRTANFHNRKIIAVSTPTVEGISRIGRLFDETDQRHFHVPCPHCGVLQVLEWGGIVYKNAAGDIDFDDVFYRCNDCGKRIEERDRPAMLEQGTWIADEPTRSRWRGYQISALYSPWVRWRELAEEWVRVHENRDRAGLQEFINLRLGERWTEGTDQVTPETLEKNRERYEADVPGGALLLTAGVDVQDNRLEVEVVGWGVGRESWGIQYAVFPGDTGDLVSPAGPWARLDAFLAKAWKHQDGDELGLWCVCVDSGGHRTTEVYEFCRARLARNVFPVKGQAGEGRPIAGKPSVTGQLRIPLYFVGVDTAKAAVFSRLAIDSPGPGYCHFPTAQENGFDDGYFKGLCSEKQVVKERGGRRRREWKQLRERNEPLDCRVYATAAMEMLVPDFDGLAAARAAARGVVVQSSAAQPQRRRRVLSRGVG